MIARRGWSCVRGRGDGRAAAPAAPGGDGRPPVVGSASRQLWVLPQPIHRRGFRPRLVRIGMTYEKLSAPGGRPAMSRSDAGCFVAKARTCSRLSALFAPGAVIIGAVENYNPPAIAPCVGAASAGEIPARRQAGEGPIVAGRGRGRKLAGMVGIDRHPGRFSRVRIEISGRPISRASRPATCAAQRAGRRACRRRQGGALAPRQDRTGDGGPRSVRTALPAGFRQ